MKAQTLWTIRRAMGWGVVGLSALAAGLGLTMVWRVFEHGAHWLFLLEPAIFLVFSVAIMRTAHSFLDRRRSGLR